MRDSEALTSARLRLRELDDSDADFLVGLYNQPDFLEFIGDRGLHDAAAARDWLRRVTWPLYALGVGFGMRGIRLADGSLVGICGLLKRDHLPFPDLGYALCTGRGGQGYAREAAALVLAHALGPLAYPRILAVLDPANIRSVRLLEQLGMRPIGNTMPPGEIRELALYAIDATPGG